MAVSKVTFELPIPTNSIPKNRVSDLKNTVGTFLIEKILEDVSSKRSPVLGGEYKKTLSTNYAKKKEQIVGSKEANLELFGDMLDSLTFKNTRDGIEIGIFNKKQAQKADNHNKFSPESKGTKVPKRQFIPNSDENQNFKRAIQNEIASIVQEFSTKDVTKAEILRGLNGNL